MNGGSAWSLAGPLALLVSLALAPAHRAHAASCATQVAALLDAAQAPTDLHRLWFNAHARSTFTRFLENGLLLKAPELRERLLRELEDSVKAVPPLPQVEIYRRLRAIVAKDQDSYRKAFGLDDQKRVSARIEELTGLLRGSRPKSLLDIGAADGKIASRLGQRLGIAPSERHALELAPYEREQGVHWLEYGPKNTIPLKTGSVELVSTLMVLHHVDSPEALLAEAHRVLKPGGKMIVRETNARDADSILFNSVADEFFYQVFEPNPGVPVPRNYRSKEAWQETFRNAGFRVAHSVDDRSGNPFTPTYFVLEKPSAPPPRALEQQVFDAPVAYRQAIRASLPLPPKAEILKDMDFYVFPTRFCPVGCDHCYFGSSPAGSSAELRSGSLSPQGIERFIQLMRTLGSRSLTITGGGEPMLEPAKVRRLVADAPADQVTLHTSAHWAAHEALMSQHLGQLEQAMRDNPRGPSLNIRVSLDQHHRRVKPEAYGRLVDRFHQRHEAGAPDRMQLSFHSIHGDPVIREFAASYRADPRVREVALDPRTNEPVSIVFRNGLRLQIDYSPLFLSDPNADLRATDRIDQAVAAFDRGRTQKPAVPTRPGERERGCLCTYESGEVELWNSGPGDNLPNIQDATPEEIVRAFGDVLYSAAIERGARYVDSLIEEVNPLAVRRAKAVSSATLFNKRALAEDKTRLYVSVRILQDYLKDGRLQAADVARLPPAIQRLVSLPVERLKRLYAESSWDIVDQAITERPGDADALWAIYEEVKRAHHGFTTEDMKRKVRESPSILPEAKAEFLRRAELDRKTLPSL